MPSLSRELRKLLENTVVSARQSAVSGARKALTALRVGDKESPTDPDQKALRSQLRAHGRQLGDSRQTDGTQESRRLEQACAYEHWHRLLFARFLAENGLLVNPDYGVAMSLAEVQETAREQNRDWLSLASDYAQRMLLEVFRPDDPVLRLIMPPEARQEMEKLLADLPVEVFLADDSLGWVYQFWQRDEKQRVNDSESKIGKDELAPVTQLFTEDYMVLYLLHNSLGAWWAAKCRGEGKSPELPGYEWTYLQLNEDGSPVTGGFEKWPNKSSDIRLLDPCMGSGHFLAFALPALARMRQDEEKLSLRAAILAVLKDNLFGLELDARCSQIAAFNLALMAWKMIGEPVTLPELNLACSGLGINASKESWTALGGDNRLVRETLSELYTTFQKAPVLGSLIDPSRLARPLLFAKFDEVAPLLEQALAVESANDESRELVIAAKGVLAASRLLAQKFTLVATNVPYLGRGKQNTDLREHCEEFHSDTKNDLATCFVDRCLNLTANGGSAVLVTPQSWLFLQRFEQMRRRLLASCQWNFVIRLGTRAFDAIGGEVVSVALLSFTHSIPEGEWAFHGADLEEETSAAAKATKLSATQLLPLVQRRQLSNPDARVVLEHVGTSAFLGQFASSIEGLTTGDMDRFVRKFWERPSIDQGWEPFIQNVDSTEYYGGRTDILLWQNGRGELRACPSAHNFPSEIMNGRRILGSAGLRVTQMGDFPCTLYTGEVFGKNAASIVPHDLENLAALWCFCTSDEFREAVGRIDQSLKTTNATFLKIPFDLTAWQQIARDTYPQGIPAPVASDETQWLFDGNPRTGDHPLQVAVARLVGYRWPRQSGSCFANCDALPADSLSECEDSDGIVCLSALSGRPPAAERIRGILATAFGWEWSAERLAALIGERCTLDDWLRDAFFAEHCSIFGNRPFVWHVWDGRKDGFHALVNYHRLVGPRGEGRKTLERLIYTSLGDWIKRQRDEVNEGSDGAEGRLTAALHLGQELEKILHGQGFPESKSGYDIFVRWKPIHEQPIGWEPDVNDGVRVNMRPWLYAKPYQASKKDASLLRVTPFKLPLGKSKGKEQLESTDGFPWYASSQDRTNDEHLTLEEKLAARERRKKA
ncbi:MAG: N-6 DNA methylase [Bryobacteraceae bacterium]